MTLVKSLVRRHLIMYLRDRWAVFFSFLSVMIILGLFILFLRNAFGGEFAQLEHSDYVIHSWILAGVVMVGTVTIPLGFLSIMVRDFETKAINDFYVAPVKRHLIVLSYLLSAVVIGVILGIINLFVGLAYLWFRFDNIPNLLSLIQLIGLLILSTALFSSIFFYATSFIKTSNTHGSLSTLVGTLIGFLAGVYVVIGSLPSTTQTIMSALPTMQIASAFRIIYMRDALDLAFINHPDMRIFYEHLLGIKLEIGDITLTLLGLVVITGLWTTIFTVLSVLRSKSFKKT